MTQILSLALGNSFPSGLSGGATPFASPGPSFTDMLGPPLASAMPQGTPTVIGPRPTITGAAGLADLSSALPSVALARQPLQGGAPAQTDPLKPMPAGAPAETAIALALGAQPSAGQSPQAPTDLSSATPDMAADPGMTPEQVEAQMGETSGLPAPATVDPVRNEVTPDTELQGAPPTPEEPTKPTTQDEPAPARLQPELAIDTPSPVVARIDADREGTPPAARSDEIPADAPAEPAAPALQPVVAPPAPNVAAPLPPSRTAPVNTGAGDGARARGVSALIAPGPQESLGTVETAILRPSSDSGPPPSPVNTLANADKSDFAAMLDTARAEPQAPLPETGSPAPEMPGQTRADGVRNQAAPPVTPGSLPATVSARPGEIGHQLGVEIARQSVDGRDSLTIRLDPVEMGEIQIRLQFDDRGTMRAIVSAENSAALEMLRRDSADLARALGDAGVRTDGQSFQFEARSHGRGDQQGQHRRPDTPGQPDAVLAESDDDSPAPPHRLRASGSLDLFA